MRLIDADKLPYKLAVNENGEQVIYVRTEDINAAPEFFRWIPVTERLPDVPCFLGISRFNAKVRVYQKREWGEPNWTVGGLYIPKDIRYWMPLPDAPEEGEK